MEKIKVVILAAGKGTRMKSELPKALMPLKGKPMIKYILEAVQESGVDPRPTIVVGYGRDELMQELGKENNKQYNCVVQDEQLGTGHAVLAAESALKDQADNIMVLPSDHPLVKAETIRKLAERHIASGGRVTMATVNLPDFTDWRSIFYNNFSRIVRDGNGAIVKDVQFKDATEEEKKITEVNPIFLCFDAKWLWEKIITLSRDNAQSEYYMTELIEIAVNEKTKIESIAIDPREALFANSKGELEMLEGL